MVDIVQRTLEYFGYQINRYPNYDLRRRIRIVNQFDIDVLFDIGANIGQYGLEMRRLGYNNKIISFEPLSNAFKYLKKVTFKDKKWIINNYAIGNEDIKSIINIAANYVSSSMLNMLPIHLANAPESKYIAQEEVEIKKLDSIFSSFCNDKDSIMVKIDTQGYEKNVLDGAFKSLNRIKVIQIEMFIVPLYENVMNFTDMIKYLDTKGFLLFSLENGFSNPNTGQLLCVDGIFISKNFTIK